MAASTKWRLLVVYAFCLALRVNKVESSQELMQKMSTSFFKALEQCKTELSLTEDVIKSLINFWRENLDPSNRDLGCVILCMATKHDLIEMSEYKVHNNNAYEFAASHGADSETAKQIVTIVRDCEKQFEANSDHCSRVLDIARCFRDHIHGLKWAPDMEVIVGEIMMDI